MSLSLTSAFRAPSREARITQGPGLLEDLNPLNLIRDSRMLGQICVLTPIMARSREPAVNDLAIPERPSVSLFHTTWRIYADKGDRRKPIQIKPDRI